MWIFLSDAYLSIVAVPNEPDKLLVRSRFPKDIFQVFPAAKLFTKPVYDYKYRALVSRVEVAQVIGDQLLNIKYTNFKDSVKQVRRHDAYFDVWDIMHRLQK